MKDGIDPKWYEKESRCSTREIYNLWYVVSPTSGDKDELSLTIGPLHVILTSISGIHSNVESLT
jgi:hypothetical protein